MLKLTGCILVICGCVGFAGSICREAKERLLFLKEIRRLYEDMQYCIAYRKEVIAEVLRQLSATGEGYFAEAFQEICSRMRKGEEAFPAVWRQCMEKALRQSPLKKKDYFLMMDFPDCIGFLEEQAQAKALDGLLRETELLIKEQEREQKDKSRTIMGVGMAAGILLSILLL